MGDKFSDAGNAIRDFLAGIGDSLVGTVKGLLTLVVDLGILYVDVRWKSIVLIQVPEVLDQEVEKIKQKYEPLLKDPVNTIGGIGQSICDTADEKGVAYSSGYIVTEVVTALLADKGLDKLKNVAKTGKTADNVADIAEGAAKGAGNAAEDAGKAGKTAGKVGETSYGKSSGNISELLENRPELTGTNREKLLSMVQDTKLAAYINEVYRPGASVGDGGTADKLIMEFYEGSSRHLPKAKERLVGINRIIDSGKLGLNDLDIAEALRDDLEYAIDLFK